MEELNIPYTKQYDDFGQLLPLPAGGYISRGQNRKQRRQHLYNTSFIGNHKGMSLTVLKNLKYERVYQFIKNRSGRIIKTIKHYISK